MQGDAPWTEVARRGSNSSGLGLEHVQISLLPDKLANSLVLCFERET
jgi:hypothetical protein